MVATIILIGLLLIKLGVRSAQSESTSEVIGAVLGCCIMLTLYYFAGLFDKFM